MVDCIIAGINDLQLQLTVRSANCKNFVELAEFILQLPSGSGSSLFVRGNSDSMRSGNRHFDARSPVYERNKPKPLADIKCFACGKSGHKRLDCTAFKARETRIICAFCKIQGHVEEICRKKARHSQSTLINS